MLSISGEVHLGLKPLFYSPENSDFEVKQKEESHSMFDLSGFDVGPDFSGLGIMFYTMYSITDTTFYLNATTSMGGFTAQDYGVWMWANELAALYSLTDSVQAGFVAGISISSGRVMGDNPSNLQLSSQDPGTYFGIRFQMKWTQARAEFSIVHHRLVFDYTIDDEWYANKDELDLSGTCVSFGVSFPLFGH